MAAGHRRAGQMNHGRCRGDSFDSLPSDTSAPTAITHGLARSAVDLNGARARAGDQGALMHPKPRSGPNQLICSRNGEVLPSNVSSISRPLLYAVFFGHSLYTAAIDAAKEKNILSQKHRRGGEA
jgi:hypothetical protein